MALRMFRYPQFDRWLATLPAAVATEIAASIDYLSEHGRAAVLPDVRHRIQTSRHFPDMSEVRTDQTIAGRRYLIRVLTCFAHADTTVVICVGGNKDGYEARTGRGLVRRRPLPQRRPRVTPTPTDNTEPAPQEWLASTAEQGGYDRPWAHPDAEFPALLEEARRRRTTEHQIVTSLAELRRAAGLNQTELAQRWGHHQPHVSKIENDPTHVELATLAGYIRALGGRLTITVEAGDHIYYEDLVGS